MDSALRAKNDGRLSTVSIHKRVKARSIHFLSYFARGPSTRNLSRCIAAGTFSTGQSTALLHASHSWKRNLNWIRSSGNTRNIRSLFKRLKDDKSYGGIDKCVPEARTRQYILYKMDSFFFARRIFYALFLIYIKGAFWNCNIKCCAFTRDFSIMYYSKKKKTSYFYIKQHILQHKVTEDTQNFTRRIYFLATHF